MPIAVTQTSAVSAAVTLPWVVLDKFAPNFNVQVELNKTGNGVFNGTIQYTLDEAAIKAGVSARALTERSSVAAATAFNMTHAAIAVRYIVASASGNNQLTFRVVQIGS